MDPILIGLLPQSEDEKFRSCSYKERWCHLKPVIVELYRTVTLNQVVEFMRDHYSFHAVASQYRWRFRGWGIVKRTVKEDKDDITSALARRKRPAASVSDATIQRDGKDKPLDYRNLKRYLVSRKPCLEIAPGLLSSWNLPYAAFVSSLPKNPGEPSPFGPLGPTPDYLHIQSPEALTPGRATDGPSPRMQLVYDKNKEHCTSLFMQGRLKQLMVSMPKEDRSTMINYFHDFYMHSFILAKNWDQELSNPNPTQAFALTPQTQNTTSPWTPSAFLNLSSEPSSPEVSSATDISCPPTQLCQWSIHVSYESLRYERSVPTTAPSDVDILPGPEPSPSSFVESLQQSMASNDFTSTPKADLPLAHDMITKCLEENPGPLQLDAWKLAIMAGNTELLFQLWEDNGEDLPKGIEAIHPFHLAAAFLDGGHQCCKIFTTLSILFQPSFMFSHNIDNFGHTILDALVVTVLRSHTKTQPDTISRGFQSPNRFPGEEKDICGRWDITSPNICELLDQGYARIPTSWKHPFCHTAMQAVCHSITTIFASPASPSINAQSGLFVRRCMEYGLELKLGPIHTLVVVTFYLAQLGMPGETLFGALAMMICLISLGADVSIKANISVEDILWSSDAEQCRHTPLSPLDLMIGVPRSVIETWSEDCRIGWTCLIQTFKLAMTEDRQKLRRNLRVRWASPLENECPGISSSSASSDHHPCDARFKMEFHDDWLKLPCSGPRMGLLWASVQTELLTYRRLREGEAWISGNFSMKSLKTWLEGDSPEFLTPLVQNRMFRTHTRCGWFKGADDFLCPSAQEVCSEYFMNMDIYDRASYINQPSLLQSFGDVEEVKGGEV